MSRHSMSRRATPWLPRRDAAAPTGGPGRPSTRTAGRTSARVRALLGLGTVLVLATPGTYAHWTDEVEVAGTTVTAGTLDLRVDGQDQVAGYTALDLSAMVPGSSTAAVLTVRNTGTAPLRYTAATSATNPDGKGLAGALAVKVTGDTATTGVAPAATCPGPAWSGTAATLDGPLIASGRLLAPGGSERVCVQVTMPSTAAAALQGATTSVRITVHGTSDVS
ncbi:SipW-dependent-type signal peptide-containing protein [Nocardioides xinjiangensis]|uniref:SipW-dependent-type signal peptide-containing protein n=1 Tax=Nocardioides xinjiangensis TaxID=2817376 RepID=UPI001B30D426|nr:SipW-dependent-type signal peptide-containing protein [Nocardioides sp. SYSU D00514]